MSAVVPDCISVAVARDATVFIVSDLHLRNSTGAVTDRVEHIVTDRLAELPAPTVVVLAGDIVELLGEPGMRPADAYAAHPELTAHLRRFADTARCRVVHLIGNHDGDLAWDDDAAAEVRAITGADLALTADLVFDTADAPRIIRVEHGNRFDPYNCFRDIRNPLDTPFGHHIVREVMPVISQVAPDWLDGATDLADPPDFPSFVGSRLAYRRLAAHLRWLVIPLLLLLVLLRVPIVLLVTTHLPESVQDWIRRFALLGAALVIDLLLVLFFLGYFIRRSWQALRTLDLSDRGYGQNNAARAEAARVAGEGYAGLVCGHSHRPELTSVAGEGFYANTGSGTPVVEAVPARLGMPPVYLRHLQVSWLEMSATPALEARLFVTEVPLPGATRIERLLAKKQQEIPLNPTPVATWPGGRWP